MVEDAVEQVLENRALCDGKSPFDEIGEQGLVARHGLGADYVGAGDARAGGGREPLLRPAFLGTEP